MAAQEIFHPGDVQRGCYSKRRYPTEDFVRKVKHNREQAGSGPLRYYGCLECGGWHLTHKNAPHNPEREMPPSRG